MIEDKISKVFIWRSIPYDTRQEMKKDLNIRPTVSVEVSNNQVINDGITEESLKDIDKEILINTLNNGKYEYNKKEDTKPANEEPIQHDNESGDTEENE